MPRAGEIPGANLASGARIAVDPPPPRIESMSVVDSLLGASGAEVVRRLAQDFGIDDHDMRDAITSLVPALVGGIKENTGAPGGLQELLSALQQGRHQRYLDDPS